jgi:1-acyl-sn-glycerol-3-phosphate acyltransferase
VIRAAARLAVLLLWALVNSWPPLVIALVTLGNRRARLATGPVLMAIFARGACAIMGVHVERSGELPPRGACFVAPTHWGYVDVVVLGSLYRTSFVSMADIAGWPVLGFYARAGGTLFIDRSRRSDAARVAPQVEEHLRRGCRVTVFLEGGAGRGDVVRPFRPSLLEAAVATGAPCVPVLVRYSLPRDPGLDPGRAVAWTELSLPGHFWGLLHLRRVDARIAFLAPRTGTERKALARSIEDDVRRAAQA